jgi:tetrameric-type glycyl-tRNA synthetase alpha subunit
MNVQDAIFRLSRFWAGEGCLVLPPSELEIAGGILHPVTFFRLLDPGPWRAAYLQTVRRPLDGRYGRHPFRLGRHLQFQVILKAPGDDVRERYLASLADLGLELAVHDLRFTEWNWQALSLDAWGLGWQVHLDGLGVTRLTYLQQLAGRDLDPVAVEISYGVERLLMAVTRTKNAFRLLWTENGPEYGDLWRREEIELSRWAREVADVEVVERQIEIWRDEARRALDAGLLRRAYELTIRSLHGIDLLDARGELSARQRAERLRGVRELVREVAGRYVGSDEPREAPDEAVEGGAADRKAAKAAAVEAAAVEAAAGAETAVARRKAPKRRKPRPRKKESK